MSKRQTISFMIFAFLYGGIGGYIGISIFPVGTISANQIFLEDQYGNRRIILSGKSQNQFLGITGIDGEAKVLLATSPDGESSISLTKKGEKVLVGMLHSEIDNAHGVAVFGENNEGRMELFFGPDGVYGLKMLDGKNRTRSFYGADDSGNFQLVFFDENGKETWKVPNG